MFCLKLSTVHDCWYQNICSDTKSHAQLTFRENIHVAHRIFIIEVER